MAYTNSKFKKRGALNTARYRDLDFSFAKNPVTKDVKTLTDINAVKKSIKNIVMTNFYERPFNAEFGAGLRRLLFEPLTPVLLVNVKERIEIALKNHEPRANVYEVAVAGNPDRNSLDISIYFRLINGSQMIDLTVSLERTR
jgi:phage baseplate assembly protein W